MWRYMEYKMKKKSPGQKQPTDLTDKFKEIKMIYDARRIDMTVPTTQQYFTL